MPAENTLHFTEITIPATYGHISGRWYGDQSVRPLLALHGWLDNCGTFAKLAPLLVRTAGSVLCIDLPGHGYSSHLPPGIIYHIMEYVRVIIGLMKSYNWSKVSLMGHSMGGSVAFYFTALYPTKVDLLIEIDIVKRDSLGPVLYLDHRRFAMNKALLDNERLMDAAILQEPPSYAFAECERLLHKGSGYSVNLENCKYILERNLSRSRKYPEKYYFSRDTRVKYILDLEAEKAFFQAMAMRICVMKIPHLVIKAGASTNIGPESTELIAIMNENNPHFETHVVPNGTHHVHLNDAPLIAKLIAPFLKRYRPLAVFQVQQSGAKNELLAKGKL
ncbi:probable serine hydrolase [Anastrepha obliqua]|uniref:probable serine hydrolase n=1 Tax=Anastrepha obliqua TaxID=95512 RepID=UPI002409F41A|nr:probable serine hydrolase [Anastrepha obliqua]